MANGLVGPEYASKFIEYRELFAKWNFDKLFKDGIESAKKQFTPAVKDNPTDVYAIISAGTSWLLTEYRNVEYNIENEHVQHAVRFIYDIFTFMLLFPDGIIRRNTRPLILAGTKYIHMFNEVMKNSKNIAGKKQQSLLNAFLKCMKDEKEVDLIFWELLCTIFKVQLTNEERTAIAEAKKKLKYEL
jgi:hypothetical protein